MFKKHKNRPFIEFQKEFLDSEVIVKTASYEYNVLKPLLFEMIDSMAGVAITKQTRVLIKPNLLLPARPERAILTHPLVVKAVAEYVINKGGDVLISDSPAWGSFEKILKIGGYQKALEGLDVELREFKTSLPVDIGKPFGSIELAKDPFEADVVINLAAFHDVNGSEDDPARAFRVNALGALFVARAGRQTGRKIVFFSSDYVFGQEAGRPSPYLEQDPVGPLNVYGVSKDAGEQLI
ncbi:hypothetical protein LCGC14_2964240, partial [marine sediment metagenome]